LAKAQELSNKNILDENDDKEADAIINDIRSLNTLNIILNRCQI